MALRAVGSYNGFIPAATGQVISFVRSPDKFKINKYVQVIDTPKRLGVYAEIDRDQGPRVVSDNDFVWADGSDRPHGDWNQMRFKWTEFQTTRRDYPFRIGNMALEQAEDGLKLLEQHTGMAAQQAVTNRTRRVITLLETASNWTATGSTDTATNLNGGAGTWDQASDDPANPHYNAIRKSLLSAMRTINLNTNAIVQPEDLILIISPGLAMSMANTGEINNYLKFGPYAKAQLEGEYNKNAMWGVPPEYMGVEIVVEDAVVVTDRPYADGTTAGARSYVKADDSAILVSRKGGIDGVYGAPSFSTVQIYYHKWQMAVFTFEDPKNERIDGHCTEDFKEILAAPAAGYLITSVL